MPESRMQQCAESLAADRRLHTMKISKLIAAAAILAFVAGACSSSTGDKSNPTPDGGTGATAAVEVHDDSFSPDALTVAANTTVTWTWTGTANPHNVVADGAAFDSGDLMTEGSYSFTFETAGVYSYFCEAHKGTGMVGTITVS